jgi:hypothetical protein
VLAEMASFLITLATWAIAFALLWLGSHELFYPPGDWIGAAIVSFFLAIGIGALRKARLERRDAALAARPEGPPRDGERVAIAGTIHPSGEPLKSPFSREACVAYDYSITHVPTLPPLLDKGGSNNRQPSPVVNRSGVALAPSIIRSGVREIRLLAYPGFERFPATDLGADKVERAREYVASTHFEEQSVLNATAQTRRILEDRTGDIRADWKLDSHDKLEDCGFMERIVPVGANACVVGLYSAKENAIVPQSGVGGTRLIRGTRAEALQFLRDSRTGSVITAIFLLVIPAPVAFGILVHREQYLEENHKDSVQSERIDALILAAKQGDVEAIHSILRHRVDVNGMSKDGDRALVNASNVSTVNALVEAGAKVDLPGYASLTPLMRAAADGRADVVQALIARRADPKARDAKRQKTALDYALDNGHEDVAKLLRP